MFYYFWQRFLEIHSKNHLINNMADLLTSSNFLHQRIMLRAGKYIYANYLFNLCQNIITIIPP